MNKRAKKRIDIRQDSKGVAERVREATNSNPAGHCDAIARCVSGMPGERARQTTKFVVTWLVEKLLHTIPRPAKNRLDR